MTFEEAIKVYEYNIEQRNYYSDEFQEALNVIITKFKIVDYDLNRAYKYFEEASKYKIPLNIKNLYRKGYILLRKDGNYSEAVEMFEKVKSKTNEDVWENRANVGIAWCFFGMNHLIECKEMIEKLKKFDDRIVRGELEHLIPELEKKEKENKQVQFEEGGIEKEYSDEIERNAASSYYLKSCIEYNDFYINIRLGEYYYKSNEIKEFSENEKSLLFKCLRDDWITYEDIGYIYDSNPKIIVNTAQQYFRRFKQKCEKIGIDGFSKFIRGYGYRFPKKYKIKLVYSENYYLEFEYD